MRLTLKNYESYQRLATHHHECDSVNKNNFVECEKLTANNKVWLWGKNVNSAIMKTLEFENQKSGKIGISPFWVSKKKISKAERKSHNIHSQNNLYDRTFSGFLFLNGHDCAQTFLYSALGTFSIANLIKSHACSVGETWGWL